MFRIWGRVDGRTFNGDVAIRKGEGNWGVTYQFLHRDDLGIGYDYGFDDDRTCYWTIWESNARIVPYEISDVNLYDNL